jgi:hypothetical protein
LDGLPSVIPAGTYQVIDSEPATWAYTSDLGNRGVTWIYGWAGGPPAVDAGSDAPSGASGISVAYTRGESAGQNALDEQLTPLIDKTAAALIQAVFTVNSFLFTDPAVTSFAAFQARKAEADQALDVLAIPGAGAPDYSIGLLGGFGISFLGAVHFRREFGLQRKVRSAPPRPRLAGRRSTRAEMDESPAHSQRKRIAGPGHGTAQPCRQRPICD